ncbi:hypothetical protein [Bradyrhizobium sp. Arg816]|uniref:hypothetical protein n=1 Tax=Bradyrhizobium sp. Arg816 TaxID=2998491 RepID=UPI00249F0F87|nr:hypothetical protein [Bradyrhizobium sp. Arg816]MDI3561908.1 hypothetical protein [Bradyrhizobium sp. Arg816]
MTRIAVLLASAAINASTISAVASECTSTRDFAASHARWTTVRSHPAGGTDKDTACRAYAASFYESVTMRQAAATCVRDTEQDRALAALDLEIDALNNLLATKCGG